MASICISGNICVCAEVVNRRRVDEWGTRSCYDERWLSYLVMDEGELHTAETRGSSQVKNEIRARRTLASCVDYQEEVKTSARLCTSSPINRVHAPMSNANDDSINPV